jgi:hypothetical protein
MIYSLLKRIPVIMQTPMNEIDTGLRILASIIARAYLEDLSKEQAKVNLCKKNEEEKKDNGNQGCVRNNQVAPVRENPAGHKEGN